MKFFLEVIHDLCTNEVITVFGTIASILSFFMTLYVIVTIRKIRKFYIFNARVPEINKRLIEYTSDISKQLNTFTEINTTIRKILANIEVDLSSLSRKVEGPLKKQVDLLIVEIRMLTGRETMLYIIHTFFINIFNQNVLTSPEKSLRNIHISLYKLTADCKERFEDARWEQ